MPMTEHIEVCGLRIVYISIGDVEYRLGHSDKQVKTGGVGGAECMQKP